MTSVIDPGRFALRRHSDHGYVSKDRPHVGMTAIGTTMLRTLCCCLALTLCSLIAAAQHTDPRENKLLVLEHMWNEAQVDHDAAALEALVSDRFVNTEWDGAVSDKQHFLADIRDPLFKPSLVTIQDVKINFFGNTAVVTGTYHTQGTYQGKAYDHLGRFTDTWIQEGDGWQCVASHTSLIKK
jgi:ketosteroid isomerase-like protein